MAVVTLGPVRDGVGGVGESRPRPRGVLADAMPWSPGQSCQRGRSVCSQAWCAVAMASSSQEEEALSEDTMLFCPVCVLGEAGTAAVTLSNSDTTLGGHSVPIIGKGIIISFSCLIALSTMPRTVLTKSGGSRHPCLPALWDGTQSLNTKYDSCRCSLSA